MEVVGFWKQKLRRLEEYYSFEPAESPNNLTCRDTTISLNGGN